MGRKDHGKASKNRTAKVNGKGKYTRRAPSSPGRSGSVAHSSSSESSSGDSGCDSDQMPIDTLLKNASAQVNRSNTTPDSAVISRQLDVTSFTPRTTDSSTPSEKTGKKAKIILKVSDFFSEPETKMIHKMIRTYFKGCKFPDAKLDKIELKMKMVSDLKTVAEMMSYSTDEAFWGKVSSCYDPIKIEFQYVVFVFFFVSFLLTYSNHRTLRSNLSHKVRSKTWPAFGINPPERRASAQNMLAWIADKEPLLNM